MNNDVYQCIGGDPSTSHYKEIARAILALKASVDALTSTIQQIAKEERK